MNDAESGPEDTKWPLLCHDCPLEMTFDRVFIVFVVISLARRLPSQPARRCL